MTAMMACMGITRRRALLLPAAALALAACSSGPTEEEQAALQELLAALRAVAGVSEATGAIDKEWANTPQTEVRVTLQPELSQLEFVSAVEELWQAMRDHAIEGHVTSGWVDLALTESTIELQLLPESEPGLDAAAVAYEETTRGAASARAVLAAVTSSWDSPDDPGLLAAAGIPITRTVRADGGTLTLISGDGEALTGLDPRALASLDLPAMGGTLEVAVDGEAVAASIAPGNETAPDDDALRAAVIALLEQLRSTPGGGVPGTLEVAAPWFVTFTIDDPVTASEPRARDDDLTSVRESVETVLDAVNG